VRALLESTEADGPTPEQLASLTAKVAFLFPLPPGGGPGPAGGGGGGGASAATSTGTAVTTKVAIGSAIGALVVGAVAGTVALVRPREVVTAAPVVMVRVDAGASVAAGQIDPTPVVAPVQAPVVPVAPTLTPAPAPRHVTPPTPVAEKTPTQPPAPPQHEDAELALLQRAMSASQRGDAQAALATALEHATTYPNSSLAQEREVIAIEALVTLGRPAEAKARVTEFRGKWPTSSHLLRLEQLVAP
jgi:hypothetical protein